MSIEKKKSFWTPQFIAVIIVNVFNGLANFLCNPIMSDYLVKRGLDFKYTGLIASLMSYVALVFRPFSGAASDRFNKKKMMFYSYGVIAICMLMYHFSDNITLSIIIRVIHGIAFGISSTVSMAFATHFIPVESLAESLGYVTLGNLIGQMFGPNLGSIIADNWGLDASFIVAGIFNIIAITIIFFLPYKHEKKEASKNEKLSLGQFYAVELTIYVVLVALFSSANGILTYYLKPYGTIKGIANITLFYTISSIAMLFFKPISGRIHDKKGIQYVLIPGYIATALSLFLISKADNLPVILAAGLLRALGQGISTPAIQAECVKILGKERSGVAVSTCYIGQDIGNAVGPTIASYIISGFASDLNGYVNMFMIYAGAEIVGLVIFLIYMSRREAAEK